MIVGLEEVQCPDTASTLILARLLQSSGEFVKPGAVVHRTECVPIAFVGLLGNLGAAVQIGDAMPHPEPLQVALGMAFLGPEGFENLHVLGEGFDAIEVAHRGSGFAVTVLRISLCTVLYPAPAD